MAEEYLDLSLNLDVGDAEKTAKDLKKAIEGIFNSGEKEKSSALTKLEQQMKANYNTAEQLRTSLEEVSAAISRTEGYITAQQEIEKTEKAISHMLRTIERAETKHPISISSLLGPETFGTAAEVEREIQSTEMAIEEARKLGYETDALQDRLTKLQTALDAHNTAVNESTINFNGASMTVGELKQRYDEMTKSLENMRSEQEDMFGTVGVDSNTALNTLRELNKTYNQLATSMDTVNDREKQQIIAHREIEKREQDRLRKEEQRVEKEQAKAEAERQRVHDRLEAHKQEQDIAEKQWKAAVEQEELEATISQQNQQRIAEEQRLQEEAAKTAEAERQARLETIEANSNFMTLMMGIRSVSGLIPGIATRAVSSVLSITTVLRRFKDVTWAGLKMAITTGLKEIGATLKNLFLFILHNPIVLAIAAAITLVVVLINKLKEAWDESQQVAAAIIEGVGEGLLKLKDAAIDFTKAITKGFLKIGNLVPSIFLKLTQKLIDRLKQLKSLVQENIDAMAKWNHGNNDINKALSNITSSLAYLKSAITAAVAPIIVYVEPVLTRLLDTLGKIFEVIGMIIAKLTGATTFQRAIRKQKDYAKSLQETNGQLASFDKLNVINQDKSAVDFDLVNLEDVKLPDWFEDFSKLAKKLSKKINKFFKSIDWNYIKDKAVQISTDIADFINSLDISKSLGKAFGETINTVTAFINNFFKKFDGKKFGKKLAKLFKTAITTINWKDVGSLFSGGLNELADVIIGLLGPDKEGKTLGDRLGEAFSDFIGTALGDIDWEKQREAITLMVTNLTGFLNTVLTPENMALIGTTLGETLNTLILGIKVFTETAEWKQWGESISTAISKFFETVDWELAGETVGNLAGAILDMIKEALNWLTKEDPKTGKTGFQVVGEAITDFFTGMDISSLIAAAKDISEKLREGLKSTWEELKKSGAYSEIIEGIVEILNEKQEWEDAFEDFKADVGRDVFWTKIWKGVGEPIINAFDSAFGGGLKEILRLSMNSAVNWVKNGINTIIDVINGFLDGIRSIELPEWLFGETYAKGWELFKKTSIPTLKHITADLDAAFENAENSKPEYITPREYGLNPNLSAFDNMMDLAQGKSAPPSTWASVSAYDSSQVAQQVTSMVEAAIKNMGVNVTFEVEGDPNGIFKVVQKEAKVYYKQTGELAFAGYGKKY